MLAWHFVHEFSRQNNRVIDTIYPETMEALVRYPWPGNIRELQNVIQRAVLLSKRNVLRVDVAQLSIDNCVTAGARDEKGLDDTLDEAQRSHILRALEQANGIVAGPNGAAARLGIKRSTLVSRMDKLGIHSSRSYISSGRDDANYLAAFAH